MKGKESKEKAKDSDMYAMPRIVSKTDWDVRMGFSWKDTKKCTSLGRLICQSKSARKWKKEKVVDGIMLKVNVIVSHLRT